MFRCILLFLLVNISYKSLGSPVSQNNDTVHVGRLLTELTKHCDNSFLSDKIKSKIRDCNVTLSSGSQERILCLIFYDINRELCATVNSNDLKIIDEDYTSKINKDQDVEAMCNVTKNMKVMNKENDQIKETVNSIFKSPIACIKVCGVPSLLSRDINFYCKYYKWGLEVLNSQITTIPTQAANKGVQVALLHTDTNNDKKGDTAFQHVIKPTDTKTAENSVVIDQRKINELESNKPTPVKIEKVEETEQEIVSQSEISNAETPLKIKVSTLNNVPNPEKPLEKMETDDIKVPSKASDESILNNNDDKKPILTEDNIGKKDETDKDKQSNEQKESNIESPKTKVLNGDTDDFQESEEGKEGLPDTQGDDDGEELMPSDLDTKMDQEQNKNSIKKIEAPVSNIGEVQKEYYPIQEGFVEDDDHFFLFFLTAVILVVLLYVLYHNKNKVSKVFFGLLVEGRQSGRRRNSRGHAYRRLDTLEQAMSTNTAAPPSKIIY